MEAGQIDVDGSVGIMTETSYTPPAPSPQEEIDPSRVSSTKIKLKGANQESQEKDKPPSNVVHYWFAVHEFYIAILDDLRLELY